MASKSQLVAKQRMTIQDAQGNIEVVEEGDVVASDSPFVKLHPMQFDGAVPASEE